MPKQPPDTEPPIALGDFYVPEHECISCGAPAAVAPDLIRHHDDNGSCYFYKQPASETEIKRAIAACNSSCVCNVRYGGTDPFILTRISALSADHPAPLPKRLANVERTGDVVTSPQPGFLDTFLKRFR